MKIRSGFVSNSSSSSFLFRSELPKEELEQKIVDICEFLTETIGVNITPEMLEVLGKEELGEAYEEKWYMENSRFFVDYEFDYLIREVGYSLPTGLIEPLFEYAFDAVRIYRG